MYEPGAAARRVAGVKPFTGIIRERDQLPIGKAETDRLGVEGGAVTDVDQLPAPWATSDDRSATLEGRRDKAWRIPRTAGVRGIRLGVLEDYKSVDGTVTLTLSGAHYW